MKFKIENFTSPSELLSAYPKPPFVSAVGRRVTFYAVVTNTFSAEINYTRWNNLKKSENKSFFALFDIVRNCLQRINRALLSGVVAFFKRSTSTRIRCFVTS